MLAGTDPRIDAAVPLITWNDLEQSLFPNAQATPADLAAPTPAAATGVDDGVFKKFWASTLMASVTTGASLSALRAWPRVTAATAVSSGRGRRQQLVGGAGPRRGRGHRTALPAVRAASPTGDAAGGRPLSGAPAAG